MKPKGVTALTAAVCMTLAAGCASGGGVKSRQTPAIPSRTPRASAQVASPSADVFSAGTAESATVFNAPPCSATSMTVTVTKNALAMGVRSIFFVLRNGSQRSCRLTGYPVVHLLDARHRPVTFSQDDGGYEGPYQDPGVRPVVLAPSATASFGLRDGENAMSNPPHTSDCHNTNFAQVTLAGRSGSVTVPAPARPCGTLIGVTALVDSAAWPPTAGCALDVQLAFEGSALAHRGVLFVITDVGGGSSCILDGYPEITLLGPQQKPIATRVMRGSGYIYQDPGPRQVSLQPSQTASFGITLGQAATGQPCLVGNFIRVAVPGHGAAFVFPADIPACFANSLDVTAIVAGSTGPPT